jgi:hypothetical protein
VTSPGRRPFRITALRVGTAIWLVAGLLLLANAARGLAGGAARGTGTVRTQPAPPPPRAANGQAAAQTAAYAPSYDARTGREVVMVFIGASFCGAHLQPGFPEAIEQAKLGLRRQAQARGSGFRAVGVSLDWEPDSALVFLRRFGRWDEVSVGGNWVSEAALRYIWSDLPGPASVPQLLVIERQLENGETAVSVQGERLVRRLLGTDQIAAWVKSGAPT